VQGTPCPFLARACPELAEGKGEGDGRKGSFISLLDQPHPPQALRADPPKFGLPLPDSSAPQLLEVFRFS